jgi:hypothetical protein
MSFFTITSFTATIALISGYLSVYMKSQSTRFKFAITYVLLISAASIINLCQINECDRLAGTTVILIAMLPVLALWLLVLKGRNRPAENRYVPQAESDERKLPELVTQIK